MKQIGFAFIVPATIVVCVLAWALIWKMMSVCKFCRRIKKLSEVKNYLILSITLILFLLYPTLVKLTLSMLKCKLVGDERYLMADLQEKCFHGRHMVYALALTLPQVFVYIIGLPLAGTLKIVRNKNKYGNHDFKMRYGLLYLGFRPGREWWELIIATRKVFVVLIGTFGSVMSVVDLQAFAALLVVFFSIVAHLMGEPYDPRSTKNKSSLLYNLEFSALTMCFMTFWGGLLFYLGDDEPGSVPRGFLVFMSVTIVLGNLTFVVYTLFQFVKEYIHDTKRKQQRKTMIREKRRKSQLELAGLECPTKENVNKELQFASSVQVLPKHLDDIGSSASSVEEKSDVPIKSQHRRSSTSAASRARIQASFQARIKARNTMTADKLHDNFIESELQLQKKQTKRQEMSRRRTMQRVKARAALKSSKKLKKAQLFSGLGDDAVTKLIDCMKDKTFAPGETIVQQGDVAHEFYVITSGTCKVLVDGKFVGSMRTHDHFGETCVSMAARMTNARAWHDGEGEEEIADVVAGIASSERRKATIVADADQGEVHVLAIGIPSLSQLFESGVLDAAAMLAEIRSEHEKRLALQAAGRVWLLSGARSKIRGLPGITNNSRSLFS